MLGSTHNNRKINLDKYDDVKVCTYRHAGEVLIKDGPFPTAAIIPNPYRMIIVLATTPTRVPVLCDIHDGVGIVVGEGMVDLGPVRGDVVSVAM